MKRIVLTFGIIAGIIVSGMMFITTMDGELNVEGGEILGYATMIIALSTIFFAIRAYRDKLSGGTIGFGKAFQIGLYITLIASALYVTSWMIITNTYGNDLMEKYYEHSIRELNNSGKSHAEIDVQIQRMLEFKEMYKNPFVKIGMTFLEIFPVGLLISLISAAILKKKKTEPENKQKTANVA